MESSTIFAAASSVNASELPTPVILGAELTPIKLVTAADGDVLHSDVKLYTHPLDVAGVAVEVGAPDDRLKAEEVRSIEIALDGSALDGAKLTINVLYRRHDDDPWTQIASLSEGL